jgi:hypothetical protein
MGTYAFNDVAATLSGPTGSVNLAYGAGSSDEGITFEAAGDKNTMQVGAGGAVQHSLHADLSGRCVARYLKTSPTNAILQQMYDLQTSSASLHGQNTIICQQKASGDVTTARQVAFKKKPAINYQKEAGVIEWEFDVGQLTTVLGTYPTS